MAFHGLDLTTDGMSSPPSPLHQQFLAWMKAALVYGGVEIAAGTKMHQHFVDAGLEAPVMQVYALIGGGRPFTEASSAYASETVRTLLPLLVKGGIATEVEVGIETPTAGRTGGAPYRPAVARSTAALPDGAVSRSPLDVRRSIRRFPSPPDPHGTECPQRTRRMFLRKMARLPGTARGRASPAVLARALSDTAIALARSNPTRFRPSPSSPNETQVGRHRGRAASPRGRAGAPTTHLAGCPPCSIHLPCQLT